MESFPSSFRNFPTLNPFTLLEKDLCARAVCTNEVGAFPSLCVSLCRYTHSIIRITFTSSFYWHVLLGVPHTPICTVPLLHSIFEWLVPQSRHSRSYFLWTKQSLWVFFTSSLASHLHASISWVPYPFWLQFVMYNINNIQYQCTVVVPSSDANNPTYLHVIIFVIWIAHLDIRCLGDLELTGKFTLYILSLIIKSLLYVGYCIRLWDPKIRNHISCPWQSSQSNIKNIVTDLLK